MKGFFKYIALILFLSSKLAFAGGEIKFIQNKGQWKAPFLFKASLPGGALFVEKSAFTYNFYNANIYHFHHLDDIQTDLKKALKFHAFKINFVGSNSNVNINSNNESKSYYNYFLGNDKSRWKSKVKAFQEIDYQNLYPQINLKLYSLGTAIKYEITN